MTHFLRKLFWSVLVTAIFTLTVQAKPGQTHYISVLQAEVKAEPSKASSTKFIVALGRKVIEFDRKGDWVYVGIDKMGGKDGWITRSALGPNDPDGLTY